MLTKSVRTPQKINPHKKQVESLQKFTKVSFILYPFRFLDMVVVNFFNIPLKMRSVLAARTRVQPCCKPSAITGYLRCAIVNSSGMLLYLIFLILGINNLLCGFLIVILLYNNIVCFVVCFVNKASKFDYLIFC